MINALLLSAGKGERLLPLTLKTPKCLLPFISDKPILQYWLDTLAEIGIETIFINTHHLKEQIIDYVNKLDEELKNRIYVYKEEKLEPVGMVLSNLRNLLGETFLIINSDTYINIADVKRFIETAKPSVDFPIFLGVEHRDIKGKSRVSFDKSGLVIDFKEKPEDSMPGYSYAGIMAMDSSVINSFKAGELKKKELTQDILPIFTDRMIAIELDNVIDIGDNLETYYQACKSLNKKREQIND